MKRDNRLDRLRAYKGVFAVHIALMAAILAAALHVAASCSANCRLPDILGLQ